jgi:hypothetical protein
VNVTVPLVVPPVVIVKVLKLGLSNVEAKVIFAPDVVKVVFAPKVAASLYVCVPAVVILAAMLGPVLQNCTTSFLSCIDSVDPRKINSDAKF